MSQIVHAANNCGKRETLGLMGRIKSEWERFGVGGKKVRSRKTFQCLRKLSWKSLDKKHDNKAGNFRYSFPGYRSSSL
jgi:hypothetical protein